MSRARKQPRAPKPDDLVTTAEAMAELGIGRSALRNLILIGELERVDVNSSLERKRPVWRIRRSSIERFQADRLDI